jgi:phage baseplate assembly protein V
MLFDEKDGLTLSNLERRLANIIRIGTIFEINHEIAKARVRIGELETNFLPWINSNSGSNNSWNPPEIGEQVVILSSGGELSQAVILPSLYKNNASENSNTIKSMIFADGSKVSFNLESGNLDLDIKGNTTIKVAGSAQIEAANITLKGNINLGGSGGQPVARVGDEIEISSGSSAGKWPIISGSGKIKSI